MNSTFRYIGKPCSDGQSIGKVTGAIVYGCDLQSPNMLHIALKPSEVAHGRILSIDCSEAMALPGVVAVYTYQNTPNTKFDRKRIGPTEVLPMQEQLFDSHIRFMGERVAAVVAKDYETAKRGCDRIKVQYETLPVVVSPQEAMQPQAPQLFETGNAVMLPVQSCGDYENCQAEYVHRSESHIGRMTHLTLEPSTTRVKYDRASGRLHIWSETQSVFGVRCTVAQFLGIPYSKVEVTKANMGGSFGSRQEIFLEPLVAYIALDLKADVKLAYSREEQMVNAYTKHSLDAQVESKVTADGKILGLKVRNVLDAGAYQTVTGAYARSIGGKLGKVYRIPNIHYQGISVCTNTPITGGFRSWATSEAALIMENHWNLVAKKIGIDPVEFRLKNIMEPYEVNPLNNLSIGHALYRKCLEQGRAAFQWDQRKTACKARNNDRYRYGIGMALTTHTSALYPAKTDTTTVIAKIQEDGSLILNTALHDHGCGTVLGMKKIAAEVMELDLDMVEAKEANTDTCMYDYGCYSSRSLHVIGNAVQRCCEELLEDAKKVAAAYWKCSKYAIRYHNGQFSRDNDPATTISLADVAQYSLFVMYEDLYHVFSAGAHENPHVGAAHFAEVEVDTYTGFVRITDYLAVHDIGRVINPQMCMGQLGSGIQQGMGIALCEEIKIHPVTGQTLISNLKNYEVANAADMPNYSAIFIEDPEPKGPFGAKSIGEVVVAPVAPALVAAVNDALDTELTHLPLTPAVILDALAKGE